MQITVPIPDPIIWGKRKFFLTFVMAVTAALLVTIFTSTAAVTAGPVTSVSLLASTAQMKYVQVPMSWIVGPAHLKGGKETSVHQAFAYAKQTKLPFVKTDGQRKKLVKAGKLKKLQGTKYLRLAGVGEPYVLPATHTFVQRLARQYAAVEYTTDKGKVKTCGKLVITGALRLFGKQPPNASPLSVHPTGMAVDLRIPKVPECRVWLEDTLLEVEQSGRIDATKEKSPPHYHVVVITKTYEEWLSRL
jgi:hypothetical protein